MRPAESVATAVFDVDMSLNRSSNRRDPWWPYRHHCHSHRSVLMRGLGASRPLDSQPRPAQRRVPAPDARRCRDTRDAAAEIGDVPNNAGDAPERLVTDATQDPQVMPLTLSSVVCMLGSPGFRAGVRPDHRGSWRASSRASGKLTRRHAHRGFHARRARTGASAGRPAGSGMAAVAPGAFAAEEHRGHCGGQTDPRHPILVMRDQFRPDGRPLPCS